MVTSRTCDLALVPLETSSWLSTPLVRIDLIVPTALYRQETQERKHGVGVVPNPYPGRVVLRFQQSVNEGMSSFGTRRVSRPCLFCRFPVDAGEGVLTILSETNLARPGVGRRSLHPKLSLSDSEWYDSLWDMIYTFLAPRLHTGTGPRMRCAGAW